MFAISFVDFSYCQRFIFIFNSVLKLYLDLCLKVILSYIEYGTVSSGFFPWDTDLSINDHFSVFVIKFTSVVDPE